MPDVFNSDEPETAAVKGAPTQDKTSLENPVLHEDKVSNTASKHKTQGHSHSPLAAYCYYPDRVNFINKDPEEVIVLLLRRHPITNLGWIFLVIVMLFAPAIFSVFPFFELLPAGFQITTILLWYLLTTAFVFEKFLGWFFNVNIVTDERIIEVDFVNLIYRELTDANIDQIQDVTVQIGGAIRTFFNYGDVVVQTAAEIPQIVFEAVPNPDKVARILRELRVEEETEKLEGRVR